MTRSQITPLRAGGTILTTPDTLPSSGVVTVGYGIDGKLQSVEDVLLIGSTNLRRTWAKLGKIYESQPWAQPSNSPLPARCTLLTLGDSIAWRIGHSFAAYMQGAYEWGGLIGNFNGENGFFPSSSATKIGETGPFTSPVGLFDRLAAGANVTVNVGNGTANGFVFGDNAEFRLPGSIAESVVKPGVSEIEVWYCKVEGAGTFSVEYNTGSAWVMVPGLESVDAATGATSTRTFAVASVTGLAVPVQSLRVTHTSGGAVDIFGGGVKRPRGVVRASLTRGGMQMEPSLIGNQLFVDCIQHIDPDCSMITFLDTPTGGLSQEDYIKLLLEAWSEINADAGDGDVVYLGANNTQASSQLAFNSAYRRQAEEDRKTYLDVARLLGSYEESNANGVMADVTHINHYMANSVLSYFLGQTGLGNSPMQIQYPGIAIPAPSIPSQLFTSGGNSFIIGVNSGALQVSRGAVLGTNNAISISSVGEVTIDHNRGSISTAGIRFFANPNSGLSLINADSLEVLVNGTRAISVQNNAGQTRCGVGTSNIVSNANLTVLDRLAIGEAGNNHAKITRTSGYTIICAGGITENFANASFHVQNSNGETFLNVPVGRTGHFRVGNDTTLLQWSSAGLLATTPNLGDNTTKVATTAFVAANAMLKGTVPATPTSTGVAGTIAYDSDFIYICTATNTWRRVAIATW